MQLQCATASHSRRSTDTDGAIAQAATPVSTILRRLIGAAPPNAKAINVSAQLRGGPRQIVSCGYELDASVATMLGASQVDRPATLCDPMFVLLREEFLAGYIYM